MRKILTALVAAASIAGAAVATSSPARRGAAAGVVAWRLGLGSGRGFAAGALIGGALAAPYYYP